MNYSFFYNHGLPSVHFFWMCTMLTEDCGCTLCSSHSELGSPTQT